MPSREADVAEVDFDKATVTNTEQGRYQGQVGLKLC